jgi:VWFA-related protein
LQTYHRKFMKCRIFIFLLLLTTVWAQTQEDIPKFSQEISVSIINLYASVRNSKGRPVYGLKKEDFDLYESGKRQTISNFSADITEPMNLAFLLDVSGSMQMEGKFEVAERIIEQIVSRLSKEDQVALLIFADGEVERLIDFTTDKQAMINRMHKLKPYGGTALRDAIAYCNRLLINSVGKKGVVLLSDGVDTRSRLSIQDATQLATRVELPIYTFELIKSKWLDDQKEKPADELPLKAFAEATGGLYFSVDESSEEEIAKPCAKIFEDLKYQYYIGYTPEGAHSAYGKLELKTKNPEHRVRVRYSVIHGG